MRPAGKGPLESLYFNYPILPARRVPELDGVVARHPVAIVGAGPIGVSAISPPSRTPSGRRSTASNR
jgi:3-(3-hydroxy-phenyl)propionate hydroxylase